MPSAGAPGPVEPEPRHVPDITGGIGGPTNVNVQPANVSLPRALPNSFSMVPMMVRQFAKEQRDTAHAHAFSRIVHNAIITELAM